ncbi:MAG: hypothetical protein ACQERI_09325 [Candidatus Krumholzibacteriota bacterium]
MLIISGMLLFCSEDRGTNPANNEIEWPDRTDVEDCLETVMMSYRHRDIEKYSEVLLKPDTNFVFPEGFYWFIPDEVIGGGQIEEQYLNYYQDVAATDSLFHHALELDLDISGGPWDSLGFFRNKECDDCWKTIREYHIEVILDSGDHYISNMHIKFAVGPDPVNSDKYVIYQVVELISQANKIISGSEPGSIIEIKRAFFQYLNDADQ